jgi:hypothetical protein
LGVVPFRRANDIGVSILMSTLVLGCGAKTGLNVPDSSAVVIIDAGVDAPGRCEIDDPVDVLFVIDNSQSMEEEQESLAAEMPRLIEALVAPPDLDGDGVFDWNPISNLQIGVITTDLGAGGVRIGSCERRRGGDGILRNVGNPRDFDCLRPFPRFLTYGGGPRAAEEIVDDLSCVVNVGIDGCGQEQHLEATLKALTPSTSDIRFEGGTTGHGDGVNSGFLRVGSFLAVVIVSDEDDCSARDPLLFEPESPRYEEHPNVRCALHEDEALHPIDRFLDGIAALRSGPDDRLALAVIGGVPLDLVEAGDPTYEAMLADPRMRFQVDPEEPDSPVPSCDVPGRGVAYPPMRLVRAAAALTPASTVQSICQEDLRPAVAALVSLIGLRTCEADELSP